MAGRRRSILALGLITSCIVPIFSAVGSETQTYTYDELGRLKAVQYSGALNNGAAHSLCYDPAGNRTQYKSSAAGALASCSGGGGGESPPSFAIGNASVTEGGNLVFTITKTGTVSQSYSVNYATANGTAAAGSDYTAKSGTLTFTSAQTSQTVSVVTTDDTTVESAETVLVNLSGATGGATIGGAQGVGTINDNDTSSNQPPVANADSLSVPRCEVRTKDVVANDTDPEGNYPLVVTAVDHPDAFVASSTTVGFQAPDSSGSFIVNYTVRDSLGATATGTLTVTITGTICP